LIAAEYEDGCVGRQGNQFLDRFQAVRIGQAQIDNDGVETRLLQ
jgi:hypothetical protein